MKTNRKTDKDLSLIGERGKEKERERDGWWLEIAKRGSTRYDDDVTIPMSVKWLFSQVNRSHIIWSTTVTFLSHNT